VDNPALTSWIIDNREAGVFRVNRRTLTDPQILELMEINAWALAPQEESPEPVEACPEPSRRG
jgi:hypothetical protein